MEELKDFGQKDTIEQVIILDEIREKKATELIPALLELHAQPLQDDVVDSMVYHTVVELLSGQEQGVLAGLAHPSARVKRLCVEEAGRGLMATALPSLLKLASEPIDAELLAAVLDTLGRFPEGVSTSVFLPFLSHEDSTVAAKAIEAIGRRADEPGRNALIALLANSRDLVDVGATECDLTAAMALSALAKIGDETSLAFLAAHIHNNNPLVRRLVHDALVAAGIGSLPVLKRCLEQGNKDEQIMAANVIGFIGDKKGADMLTARMTSGAVTDQNVKFAIYEGLGRINSIRSMVCLSEGLAEQDELVLMAVVTGLDNMAGPAVLKVLKELLDKGDEQAERLRKAIVTAQTISLFRLLYQESSHGQSLVEAIMAAGNDEARELFRETLLGIDNPQASADAERLGKMAERRQERRIVAADDSKAMLFFYQGVAADLGCAITTAADGREALAYLKSGTPVDLLITDMNMPNMDGIQLTSEVRKMLADLPILMATTESERAQSEIAAQAGVTAFISKPFSKAALKEKIAQLFPAQ